MSARKQTQQDTNSFSKRRVAYALAAGAAVVSADAVDCSADVVYSGTQNLPVQLGLEPLALQMNDGDTFTDITLSNYVFGGGYYQGAFVPFFGGFVVGRAPANGLNYAAALTEGYLVDGSAQFKITTGASMAYGTVNPNAQFNDVEGAFVGFAFPINGNEIHYGWLRVNVDNALGEFTVVDWAWEGEAGVGIAVGDVGATSIPGDLNGDGEVNGRDFLAWQRGETNPAFSVDSLTEWQDNYNGGALVGLNAVPEPFSLGLLAAGASGLVLMRRLRQR